MGSFLEPLRDPRNKFDQPVLRSDTLRLEDLTTGILLEGTVRDVVDSGAFVDVDLKQGELLHISKISESYIKHPSDILSVGDVNKVYVLEIDERRGQVKLSKIKP